MQRPRRVAKEALRQMLNQHWLVWVLERETARATLKLASGV